MTEWRSDGVLCRKSRPEGTSMVLCSSSQSACEDSARQSLLHHSVSVSRSLASQHRYRASLLLSPQWLEVFVLFIYKLNIYSSSNVL